MAIPSSRFIQNQSPSKRRPITEDQVTLLVSLMGAYTEDLCQHFGLRRIAELNLDNHEQARTLRSYGQLIMGAYASGFVCKDLDANFDLCAADRNPEAILGDCTLSALRHYIHTLFRCERVSGSHGSPILASLQSGAFGLVATRLKNDRRLRPDAYTDQ